MNAIILCAGKGTRLFPFSLHHPKPLLAVDGQPLIERTIELLLRRGIDQIVCVMGFMHEQFDYLAAKYGVILRFNPQYETRNNHSSVLVAVDFFQDSLILDGDLFITQDFFPLLPNGQSCFLCQKSIGPEWEVFDNSRHALTHVVKNSTRGHSMSGVSYWTAADAHALIDELRKCTEDEYWEDAALRLCLTRDVTIVRTERPFQIEIDSFDVALDQKLLTAENIASQCDDNGFAQRLKSLTNQSFKICINGRAQVLRFPGDHTSDFIDRSFEPLIVRHLMEHTQLTPRADYWGDGFKLTEYLDHYQTVNRAILSDEIIIATAHALRQLHSVSIDSLSTVRLRLSQELRLYEQLSNLFLFSSEEHDFLVQAALELDQETPVLCHRDLVLENLMWNAETAVPAVD